MLQLGAAMIVAGAITGPLALLEHGERVRDLRRAAEALTAPGLEGRSVASAALSITTDVRSSVVGPPSPLPERSSFFGGVSRHELGLLRQGRFAAFIMGIFECDARA